MSRTTTPRDESAWAHAAGPEESRRDAALAGGWDGHPDDLRIDGRLPADDPWMVALSASRLQAARLLRENVGDGWSA